MPSASRMWVIKAGDILDGKYRVERVLGAGGMGVVVAARHVDLDKQFALKLMRADSAMDPDNVERFLREARAAVQLRGDHCVRVIDVSRLEDGTPYMVMELLAGRDLGAIVERDGPLPVPDAVGYVLQACEGIAEAHARGIIHRDVKLQNLVLTRRVDGSPLVKVLDFGLAKMISTSRELRALTQSAAVMGSPMYMSPEQMRASRDVDTRTDVWSLGVCLYELLTGHAPFEGATVPELCSMVLTQPPSPMPPSFPPALARIVSRCLEKNPAARFGDVAELAAALEPFAREQGVADRIRRVLAEPPAEHDSFHPPRLSDVGVETRTAASLDTLVRSPGRRTGVTVGIAIAVAALAAFAAFAVGTRMDPGRTPAAASIDMEPPPLAATSAPLSPTSAASSGPDAAPATVASGAPAPASVQGAHHRHGVPKAPPAATGAPRPSGSAPLLEPKTTQF